MAFAEKRGKGKDGKMRWRGRYKLPNGRYGSVTKDEHGQVFTTKKAAEQYAAGLESDVRRKTFVNPRDGRITIGDWAETWIESIEVGNRSEKTYRQRLRSVILPEWAETAVGDVLTVGYVTWEKKLKERYSEEYVKSVRTVFRTMMDDAVASKLRADNPVPTQRARRRGKFQGNARQDDTVIATPRQTLLIARNAERMWGLNGYVLVLTLAYMGLRISELAGLRREHLLLDDAGAGPRLLVAEQHQYVDGKPAQVDPKYGSSGSLIVPPFLVGLLRQQLDAHEKEWVFTAPKGGKLLLGSEFYSRAWRPWVDGRVRVVDRYGNAGPLPALRAVAGVAGITPHGLRHSMKVWLDEGGHPRVAVESRMRHVMQGVEGTYSHVTLGMELKIAQHLQDLWEGSRRVVVDRREFEPVRSPQIPPQGS